MCVCVCVCVCVCGWVGVWVGGWVCVSEMDKRAGKKEKQKRWSIIIMIMTHCDEKNLKNGQRIVPMHQRVKPWLSATRGSGETLEWKQGEFMRSVMRDRTVGTAPTVEFTAS